MKTKEIAQKWFDEVWNKKNASAILEMAAPTAAGCCEGLTVHSPTEFIAQVYEPMLTAFPDVEVLVDGIIVEDNEAVVRWTAIGTHQGPFAGVEPSGRRVKFSGMTWQQMEDGKIASATDSYNLHGVAAFLATGQECASVRQA